MLFGNIHWHKYVLYSMVILYNLSFVMFSLCFSIVCMRYFNGYLLYCWVGGSVVVVVRVEGLVGLLVF